MFKTTNQTIPLAAGTTAAIIYVLCVILSSINGVDAILLKYLDVTMHGINVSEIWAPDISLAGVFVGIIATFLTWYIIGSVFEIMLRTFSKK
ncbi:MAG: hypothetical protein CEN89_159 [Candidatus Berkelbacteria bacterium Licking1014_7]|uniref:Uncharacterized protein n=1 Tax=Candidatus Berkelbacteria bacterium Licking1014_7 TaxID=2017147 RepID=A0A554LK41_9BACT|nr:MAG: hypothetical protein CEN89_159 [Candidatus Berkelbacteria bacterium Licking1014_7]